MKKFIVSAVCAVVALCSIPFAACSSSENNGLINLADCEIGYELPVYPDCEFDYKVDDDCVVHISEIKAVLTAKNEINEGDLVEKDYYYYRYIITANVKGYLSSEYNSNSSLYLSLICPPSDGAFGKTATADSNNNIEWEIETKVLTQFIYNIQFYSLDC